MSTAKAPIAPARQASPRAVARPTGRPGALLTAGALAAVALAAGALAGCGTPRAGSPSGGTTPTATASATAPSAAATSGAPATSGASATSGMPATSGASGMPAMSGAPTTSGMSTTSGASASPATSPGSATPVRTVSGGPVTPGEPACDGWPADAPTASLPVSFVPVAVERCVNGAQTIPGKGLWQTASLQRADSGLDALVSALHQPSDKHQPGMLCPALAMIPPAIVLISATGQELIPRLPVNGCGLIQSQVLAALATLPWRLVSIRLIAPIPGSSSGGAVP